MGRYFMLNKPWGCVCARRDDRFPTVLELFPEELRESLHIVGRLDKDTEGLILLTDDGKFDYYLMRPEHHVSKTYFFWAFGERDDNVFEKMSGGIELDGKPTGNLRFEFYDKCTVSDISEMIPPPYREKMMKNPGGRVFSGTVTVTEGRTHLVRKLLRYAGCAVIYLKRTEIGALDLEKCPEKGDIFELTDAELRKLGYIF